METLFVKSVLAFLAVAVCLVSCSDAAVKKTAAKPSPAKAAAPQKARGCISKTPYIGAIILDADTGNVLFEDKADAPG